MDLDFIQKLIKPADTKIVFLVMDGLGGLPIDGNNKTELETARTPNFDSLASKSICGLQQPIGSGITPGSGPGHLSLFGYDPIKYQVGRGVLSALGINFDLQDQDVAVRGNFCTIDKDGKVLDRRAGRIPTEKNQDLCKLLYENIDLPDVEIIIKPVKEHLLKLLPLASPVEIEENLRFNPGEKENNRVKEFNFSNPKNSRLFSRESSSASRWR